MLLIEFLKAHRKVEELEATVAQEKALAAQQHEDIARQQQQIEALSAGLRKVTTRCR